MSLQNAFLGSTYLKLMVYIICAGINPNRVLPIVLDLGTNNEKLLKDPMILPRCH